MRRFGTAGALALLSLTLLGACGSSKPAPSEKTTYACALGRSFAVTVRPGDDRVVLAAGSMRLLLGRPENAKGDGDKGPGEKPSGDTIGRAGQFTNGAVTLTLAGEQATLEGAPGGPYESCQAAGPPEKTGPEIPPLKVE